MKTTDLMLGDWVCVAKNFAQKYHRVRALSNDENDVIKGTYINDYGVECNSIFSCNDIEPIPLTPEILGKNGFVLKSDGWLWCEIKSIEDKNYIFIQYRKGCQEVRLCEMNFVNNVIMRSQFIQYVHELQHALKLFKIKKEIVL